MSATVGDLIREVVGDDLTDLEVEFIAWELTPFPCAVSREQLTPSLERVVWERIARSTALGAVDPRTTLGDLADQSYARITRALNRVSPARTESGPQIAQERSGGPDPRAEGSQGASGATRDPDGRCVAVCRQCEVTIPFADRAEVGRDGYAERDRWIDAHAGTNAHEVAALDGWPSPPQAWALAFGDQA